MCFLRERLRPLLRGLELWTFNVSFNVLANFLEVMLTGPCKPTASHGCGSRLAPVCIIIISSVDGQK